MYKNIAHEGIFINSREASEEVVKTKSAEKPNIYHRIPLPSEPEDTILGERTSFYAEQIRKMNRDISKLIPEDEKNSLMDEHRELVKKKMSLQLSAAEQRRLQFVRWQLDRIDDAESGDQLDRLEYLIRSQQNFSEDIQLIFSRFAPKRQSPPRSRR